VPDPATYPAHKLIEALDLLDQLVDPLKPLSFEHGVLQGRIQGWKAMMRAQVNKTIQQGSPLTEHQKIYARMDGLPPYGGG
jgi:hypothetical protein